MNIVIGIILLLLYFLAYFKSLQFFSNKYVEIPDKTKKILLVALLLTFTAAYKNVVNLRLPYEDFFVFLIVAFLTKKLFAIKFWESAVLIGISKVITEVVVLLGLIVLWTVGLAPK